MRRAMLIVGCLVACGLAFAACGGGDSTSASSTVTESASTVTAPTTTTEPEVVSPTKPDFVVLVAGTTVSGGGRKTVKLGTSVRIQVVSDVKDEVHLHGYDTSVDVDPGRPATLAFTADVPGIFEVELESAGLKLMDLVVK